jgi:hypothetical protein
MNFVEMTVVGPAVLSTEVQMQSSYKPTSFLPETTSMEMQTCPEKRLSLTHTYTDTRYASVPIQACLFLITDDCFVKYINFLP